MIVVNAGFLPQAKLDKIVIGVADFVPPQSAVIYLDRKFFLPEMTRINWDHVNDYGEQVSEVEYQLKINDSVYKTYNNYYLFNFFDFVEGEYTIVIRACDKVGNCSKWSENQSFIIDKTPPTIEVIDQKMSINEPRYLYLKAKIKDDLSLSEVTVFSGTDRVEKLFFSKGYFYEMWSDQLGDEFWIIIQIPEGRDIIQLVTLDLAGNSTNKELHW